MSYVKQKNAHMLRIKSITLAICTMMSTMSCVLPNSNSDKLNGVIAVRDTTVENKYSIYAILQDGEKIGINEELIPARTADQNDSIESPRNEFLDFWAPPSYPLLINYTVKDGTLFLLRAQSGIVSLHRYQMMPDGCVEKRKAYFVDHHALISSANGGDYFYNADFLWIAGDLFIYIKGSQMYGGSIDGIYKYSFAEDTDPTIFTGTLPEVNPVISKVEFAQPLHCISMFTVSKRFRSYYKEKLEQPVEMQDKEFMESIAKHMDKPYYYREVSADGGTWYQKIPDLGSNVLTAYTPFSEYTHDDPDSVKLANAKPFIQEVLEVAGLRPGSVKLLGSLNIKSTYDTYFFYTTPGSPLQILIFDRYNGLWTIPQYKMTNSEPRQLWFHAGD